MGKASEIWKEIKPKIGEMLMAVNNIETQAEKAQEEAYQKGVQDTKQHWVDAPRSCAYKWGYENGLNDAWETARKIGYESMHGLEKIGFDFSQCVVRDYNPSWFVVKNYSVYECIEKIRHYEQEKELEQLQKGVEKPIRAEYIMRQYLDTFCKGRSCSGCPLNTPDFTCGRGYHFLTAEPVSDEEVRRAYNKVLQKMREE